MRSSFSVNVPAGTVACSRQTDVSEHVAKIVEAVSPLLNTKSTEQSRVFGESVGGLPTAGLLEAIAVCRDLVTGKQ